MDTWMVKLEGRKICFVKLGGGAKLSVLSINYDDIIDTESGLCLHSFGHVQGSGCVLVAGNRRAKIEGDGLKESPKTMFYTEVPHDYAATTVGTWTTTTDT